MQTDVLRFLIILLLMSPHEHVNSRVKQESTTVLHKGSKLVGFPKFTKSSLSPEHFESKPPSRVQANHHLSLLFLFLLTPVRLKDSSIIIGPEKVDYTSHLCRKRWSLSSSASSWSHSFLDFDFLIFCWFELTKNKKLLNSCHYFVIAFISRLRVLVYFYQCYTL